MRWRALQTGRVYVNQHPEDAHLTAEDLKNMINNKQERLIIRVLHFASSLCGTNQYWYKQKRQLISMVDTLGMPTVFFTHSAADTQWPELARLLCPGNENSNTCRSKAVANNPAIADWFFVHKMRKFIEAFYINILGASDYWYRFEWQHRGSPHVHGIAWFQGAPDVEKMLASTMDEDLMAAVEHITGYTDKIVTTMNPGISPDGSNSENAPLPQTNPHVCNKPYAEVQDFNMDLVELIATCQRHTRCSTAYCLQTKKGKQACRFNYPKSLQAATVIDTDDSGHMNITTRRNDPLLNSYNPIQLSSWRVNVDMQYVISRYRVLNYLSKYAAKPESRSQGLKLLYNLTMKKMKDNDNVLKFVQQIMINSIGERDYSAQETCHLLLQLPMYRASRDFLILSLDGSRQVEDKLESNEHATIDSQIDHYCARPHHMESVTLMEFVQRYRISKKKGSSVLLSRS